MAQMISAQIQFHTVPDQPKVGEAVSVFLQMETLVTKNEFLIEAKIDTTTTLKFTKTADQLWVAHLKPYHEIKSHIIDVDIFVQDEKEAIRIRSARSTLIKDIADIDLQLATETNAQIIQRLQSEKLQKQQYNDQLLIDYTNLKQLFKSELYNFEILPDSTNLNYPIITSVTQNAVPLAKRIRVQITGQNFSLTPSVKMGGLAATVQTVSSTMIDVLAPNFTTTGSKNIEIIFPAQNGQPRKNTILTDAFFVSDNYLLKNIKPVVVTTGYLKVTQSIPAAVTLSAVGSYDENGDAFNYEWSVTRIPTGSTVAVGAVLANSVQPTFIPDVKGIYTFRVRLKETLTTELLASLYSTFTLEVK